MYRRAWVSNFLTKGDRLQETELPTDPEEQAGSPAIVDEERLNDPEKTDTDIPDISPSGPDEAEEIERPVTH